MHRWRHIWRPLTDIGSALLTLSMFILLALWLAPTFADKWLANNGVTDWHIKVGHISAEQLLIDELQLTYQQDATSSNTSDTHELTISDIANYKLPSWLPSQIVINQFEVTLNNIDGVEQIVGGLRIDTREPAVTVSLKRPANATLEVSRKAESISAKLSHAITNAQLNYDSVTGDFDLNASVLLSKEHVNRWSKGYVSHSLSVLASVNGSLPAKTPVDDPRALLRQVNADTKIQLDEPLSIKHPKLAAAVMGSATFAVDSGILNHYRLDLSGLLTPTQDIPMELGDINWQLQSSDRLAVDILMPSKALQKTRWPLVVNVNAGENSDDIDKLSVKVDGSVRQQAGHFLAAEFPNTDIRYDRIQLPQFSEKQPKITAKEGYFNADIAFYGGTAELKLNNEFSSHLTTQMVSFDAYIGNFNAIIDTSKPLSSNIDFSLNIRELSANKRLFADIDNIYHPVLSQQVSYNDWHATIDGDILFGDGISVSHNTQIDENLQLSSTISANVESLAASSTQRRLKPILSQFAPLLTLSNGNIQSQAVMHADLKTSDWGVTDGKLTIKDVDGIYDTLAIADLDIDANFSLTPANLSLTQASLELGSIQQGFSVGPMGANFTAQIPLDNIAGSQVTLQQHRIRAFGGNVTLPNQSYQLSQDLPIPIVFERLNLGELMRQYPTDKIAIDGEVSGTIPLGWNSERLTVERGYVNAVAPGGKLQVDSSALRSAVGGNPSLQTLASVLENFYYQELASVIDYDENGDLTLGLELTGYNPAVENGRTVKLNITLQEDLPALIQGLQLSNSVSDVIRQRIQQRVN
ncbi:dicarboxylate transport [Idiomarina aquatica]|uniref:Dicarboxylate transport n=1 Tax=Idiomarina aquatica TaxID=1327752 RepID=A0A4R6PRT0_9GAMM|nr:YdbH domain-containing protein [Idiomarina aquatica]TDP40654.1 dicarboxylate transport [Idiomarina aquatica]